ncbi:uncharacterized mitochondrial protein-like protein [Tanacetum coccineum]|uniref:Uncharacterized mitochondrial protein-like protein n=1 Tax=Tanacetum coccineum TaxID=301880 RepID=A0ABQ5HZA3_9ASTR
MLQEVVLIGFDLDFLTNTMNYIPVSVENQVNVDAEIAAKAIYDATRQAFEEEKKKVAQTTSINKLNISRPSFSTSNSPLMKKMGAEADFNNMDNTIDVSPILTLRVHKDHPKGQILGDPKSTVQTRGNIQKASLVQQALVSYIYNQKRTNHKDHQNCFVDPAHPNKVYKVIKALYGLHQAPRAWCETLSSFLLKNDFKRGTIEKTLFIKKNKSDIMLVQVYVDDIIFGFTTQSMCTEFEDCMHKRFQMSSMGELIFFLGLQVKQQPDGIFISQDKYVADILKKFDFCSIKKATTPIASNKPLVKDEDGVDVDVHIYRYMIGSLMYLTASRPDIMFAVCACARFQVTPKASHLNAVKRIFRATYGAELVSAASLVNTARPTLSTARLSLCCSKANDWIGSKMQFGLDLRTFLLPVRFIMLLLVLALESIKDAQAAEISALKSRIKKLEKKCKPSISHHRAWLKSMNRESLILPSYWFDCKSASNNRVLLI